MGPDGPDAGPDLGPDVGLGEPPIVDAGPDGPVVVQPDLGGRPDQGTVSSELSIRGGGCNCRLDSAGGATSSAWLAALFVLALRRRRR
jgi:MYXO-CTERM domain-containing protein